MTAEPREAGRTGAADGWMLLLARLALGGTFVAMGAAKAGDPVPFLKLVHEYGLVPEQLPWLLNGLAVTLPWVELVCGALLLAGVGLRGAAACMVALLVVFSGAILWRALEILEAQGGPFCAIHFDCGCGSGDQFVCAKLPTNLLLLALCWLPLRARRPRWCLRADLLARAPRP